MKPKNIQTLARSGCPIASSLDLVGDKWSLVIVRDLLNGKSRFGEFLESPERITTSVLADRLRRLEQQDIIVSQPYDDRPVRFDYRLTEKGQALHPVLQTLCRWGNEYLPGTWIAPEAFMRKRRSQVRR